MPSANYQDKYWEKTYNIYSTYPTVRHRARFILSVLSCFKNLKSKKLLDFGCGNGELLTIIQKKYFPSPENLYGSDISSQAIKLAQKKLPDSKFVTDSLPEWQSKFDIIICSEVIEHLENYEELVKYLKENLKPSGILILTTQSGKIHQSDLYTGHTQHFTLKKLNKIFKKHKLNVLCERYWGFPLFTIQKYLTDYHFSEIKQSFLEGESTLTQKIIFQISYLLYFLHDLIPLGPQIYLVASPSNQSRDTLFRH